jgi:acyl-CoA dehydrogenase
MTLTQDRSGVDDRTTPTVTTAPTGNHWTGASNASTWLALATELAPRLAIDAERHDREGTFAADSFELLRQYGLMSMLVPAELGGGGATHAEAAAVLATLAHGCPNAALALSMHSHLVAAQVWRHHRQLPAPVLAKVAAEQITLISTGASDWMDSSGHVTEVDGGYRVTAQKAPASGCPAGHIAVSSFRWEDAPGGPQVLHAAVPFNAPGVRIEETWDTLGMRGTGSHTIVFDDVFVPTAAVSLARPAGVWHPVWATVLGSAMPLIMASYVGVAEAAAERALELAAGRRERPETVSLVGRMHNRLTRARDAVAAMIAASNDLHFDNTPELASSMLTRKTNAAEACIDTARLALEVTGGAGFARSSGIERLYRDVHGALYHPLPAAQQERFSGRVTLGLDPI